MADNVTISAGTGTNIATDQLTGGEHVQFVKLMDGTLDGEGKIAGDATNGLDVDVTRVIAGTTATALGKAEDAAHTSGDTGVMALSVRSNSAAATSGADGDYQPLITDTNGRLHVLDQNSAAILADTANMDTNLGTIAGDTTSIDGKITACNTGAVVISSGSCTVDLGVNNDVTCTNTTAANLKCEATIAAAQTLATVTTVGTLTTITNDVSIDDGGNTITVDGTVTANLSATDNTVLDNIDTQTSGAETAVEIMDDWDAVHDSAIGSDGATVMAQAIETDGSAPGTAVAENDATRLKAGRDGVLLVNQTHPYHWSASADYAAAQTNTTVKAAAGAGLKLYVTDIFISNGATAGNVTLLDGSGGTVLIELYAGTNGGASHSFRTPLVLTANTLLAITSTTVTTHSVTVSGYIAP